MVARVGRGRQDPPRAGGRDAVRAGFRDSFRWIDLAPVRDPERLPVAAAAAVGVTDQSTRPVLDKLLDHLRLRRMLIVVDNCEHLLDAVAKLVATVLGEASEVCVLATSREALGVDGEFIYVLPPLSTPPAGTGYRAVDLAPYEAVTLLAQRAQAVVAEFAVTDRNADAVAALCIQLCGIPLAIELAATRLRSMSATHLVERLDHRFAPLTGG